MEAGQLVAGYYRLAEYIGAGAMGIVWRAVDERLERSVAVKKIVGQHGLSPADRAELHQRAMREAKNAARLQHPNAIMVFDITEHEGDPCLVMEYLPSHSLSELLAERGTLSVPEVARVGEQVASALLAAHQVSMVHRDVKPGNILIDAGGVAKLTDFGISRAQGDMTLTQTGLVGGTPAYLAPELARGADPSPASDVFALGATLYHAIEGHSPFGDNPNQLALLHTAASGKVQPPRHAGAATALLNAMLQPNPKDRIAMAQAGQRLAAVAAGGGAPVAHAELPSPPPGLPATAELKSPPWRRTSVAAAAAPAKKPRTGTAMFDAVGAARAGTPPPRGPAPKAAKAAGSGAGKPRGKGGLFAGAGVLLVAVVVAVVLLLNQEKTPQKAAQDNTPPSSEQAKKPPASKKKQEGGPIELSAAGNLIVDFYSFPDGVDASWAMLSEQGKARYPAGKPGFDNYWSKFDSVHSQDIRGKYNDDGSVTMTGTVVKTTNGKERSEQRQFHVIRQGGKLLIDSGTR